ncbi:hypothetical protein SAMN05216496_0409 [Pseudomonas sp. Z003-0.4C(8344-21)]|nr:hypothetical protein SAMN05216496_0409 [Pseudomonas sp. Z003-0.4C(8344-21)]SDT62218.1 hypothetical protein SAMN05216579_4987 [Pseudomonas granadensis]
MTIPFLYFPRAATTLFQVAVRRKTSEMSLQGIFYDEW